MKGAMTDGGRQRFILGVFQVDGRRPNGLGVPLARRPGEA